MKHIRKYNENRSQYDEIIEYIGICFIELYDNKIYDYFSEEYEGDFIIALDLPDIKGFDIKGFIENSKMLTELYEEVENCIEKVKIKYDIPVTFEYQWPPEGYIRIMFKVKNFNE